jgi:uncharacterized protein YwgA
MASSEEIVTQVLQAGDGRITGRIRLQKIFYLLEQAGLGSGFRFSYYHYGPYSEDLSIAVQRAEVLDKTVREEEKVSSYGYLYSEFTTHTQTALQTVGNLPVAKAKQLVAHMKGETSVVVELAATVHWLREKEKVADWKRELVIRKPGKATTEQINRAVSLLQKLDLAA